MRYEWNARMVENSKGERTMANGSPPPWMDFGLVAVTRLGGGGWLIGRRIYYHGGESRLVPSHAYTCMYTHTPLPITSLDTTDFPVTKIHSSPPTSLDLFLRLLERGRDTFAIGIYIYIYFLIKRACSSWHAAITATKIRYEYPCTYHPRY